MKYFLLLIIVFFTGCSYTNQVTYDENKHGLHYYNNYNNSYDKDKLIIFVHGLSGDSKTTWTYNKNGESKVYWLDLIKNDPQFKEFHLSTLGYPTDLIKQVPTTYSMAKVLNQELLQNKVFDKYKEIHFITHSLGGIITQDIILLNEDKKYLSKIKSVTLISTPSKGSIIADLVSKLNLNNNQVTDLREIDKNDRLKILDDRMRKLLKKIKKDDTTPRFYFSYENNDIVGLRDINRFDDIKEAFLAPYTHIDVAKPTSKNHMIYKFVKDNIIFNSDVKLLNYEKRYDLKIFGYNRTTDLHRMIKDIKKVVKLNSIKLCDYEVCFQYDKDDSLKTNYKSEDNDNVFIYYFFNNLSDNSFRRNRIQFNVNDIVLFQGLNSIFGNEDNNSMRVELVHKNFDSNIEIYLFNDIYINKCFISEEEIFN